VLLLLPYFCPLILPRNVALYHHRLPVTNIVDGLLLDLLGAIAIGVVLIALISRVPALPRRIFGACMAGLIVWRAVGVFSTIVVQWNSNLGSPKIPHGYGLEWDAVHFWSHWFRLIAIGMVLFFALLVWLRPRMAGIVIATVRFGLAASAFSAFWIVPTLVTIALARPKDEQLQQVSVQPQRVPEERIVWILFDELSENLVFDHRPSGLSLNNFDRLSSHSVTFRNLQPVGFYTDRVIPSVLAGYQIRQIESTYNGGLRYLDDAQHRWLDYDPKQTLFGLAQANGWNAGVAGWYIPYCRTFGPVLSACSWVSGIQKDLPFERDGATENQSALANALILPETTLAGMMPHGRKGKDKLIGQNIRDYQQVMSHAEGLLWDGRIHFVFLHLPAPHPPGFYNRKTHQLREGGNYIDNLALADDTLGELRREIGRTPWAKQTLLIISSDHSWRVPLWRTSRNWTQEEERISGGRFDPRPVFVVHFPGERKGWEISAPLSELIEHAMIAAMLRGEVEDRKSLEKLLPAADQPRRGPHLRRISTSGH
jgi:hypothetical protein